MQLVKKQTATQSQKLMVFVLTMALYGLATLFTELLPKFQVGFVEFSVEFFLFIPLTLAILFDPLSAALGAATGELVFSEIMFGGLGELEKFLTVTIGVYIAGLFCLLPTMFLVPRLYGKIEPLLGMRPRDEQTGLGGINIKVVIGAVIAFAVAAGAELLASSGTALIEWEADWAESGTALAVGLVTAAVVAVIALVALKYKAGKGEAEQI